MKTKEVKIDGITYQISSTTEEGLKKAIKDFKRTIKKDKERNEETED